MGSQPIFRAAECRWRVIARFSAKLHGFDSGLGGPGEKQNEHSCVANGMICRSRAKFVFGILFKFVKIRLMDIHVVASLYHMC